MNNLPLVSIVTPSYNQGDFVDETIQSVLAQTYPRIEYIVIDGGSTDNSVDIIRRHEKHLAYWISEPDRGQAHGINKGLERTSGEIIGWLNSDDTLMPDAVRRVVNAMEDVSMDVHGDAMVIHGGVQLIDAESHTILRPKLSKRKREFGLQTVIDDGLVNQPGTFWTRAAMERVGYLNEDLHYIMDYDLWVRLALAGAQFKRLQDPPLATYRLTSDTKTVATLYEMGLEKLALLDRLMSDPELSTKTGVPLAELERKARRARSLACLKIARGYAQKPGYRLQALQWFARAVRLWPACLLLFPEYLVKRLSILVSNPPGAGESSW